MAEIEEIQTHSSQKVYLDIYGGSADALPVVMFNDLISMTVTQEAPVPASGITDRYSVTLTMAQTQDQGEVNLAWAFTMATVPVTKTDYFNVFSPILSDTSIKKIHPNATSDEVIAIERAVRLIIQAYTGQEFGHYVATKEIRGKGSKALYLPARLLELTSVNGIVDPTHYQLVDDGFTLINFPWGFPADAYFLTSGVIHQSPYWFETGIWDHSCRYMVAGEWGYTSTPAPVAEAARLLVNDYACGDNQYRDRFLTSMTAADWRIQFNDGAFTDTGNVRANQLLHDYILTQDWVVI